MKTSIRICTGSDCRKHKKRYFRIAETVQPYAKVRTMKCQDFCKGPVVQVRRGSDRTWFHKVRSKKLISDLLDFITDGELSTRLEKRRVRQE